MPRPDANIIALTILRTLFEAPVPDELLCRLPAHPLAADLAEEIVRNLLNPPSDDFERAQAFSRAFRVRERWRDRLRLVGFEPNARDHAFVALPPYFKLLYAPIRPVRLMRDYGLNCVGTIVRQLMARSAR